MKTAYFLVPALLLAVSACSHEPPNTDPGILGTEPYSRIQHLSKPTADFVKISEISVTTRGETANILNTMPQLYKKALEQQEQGKSASPAADTRKLAISNIRVKTYSKREDYQAPYQDCQVVHRMENVPKQECRPVTKLESVPKRECHTRYESVSVPYQNCSYSGGRNNCITSYRHESRPKEDCQTTYRMENVSRQECSTVYRLESVPRNECQTRYRTEQRDVLYQSATADVLSRR